MDESVGTAISGSTITHQSVNENIVYTVPVSLKPKRAWTGSIAIIVSIRLI
jgi:hypothetical protein